MAIDASIALGIKPVQIENPLNNMVKFYNIRNDMQTNQMNQMKMEEANRLQEEDIGFKNALANIADPYSPEGKRQVQQAYYKHGRGDKYEAMQASEETSKKAFNEGQKQLIEEGHSHSRDISADPTAERIANRNLMIQRDSRYNAEQKAEAADNAGRLINMPYEQRKMQMAQAGASASDLKPRIADVQAGGSTVTTATPAFGGPTMQVGEVAHTLPPEQAMYAPTDLEDKQARYKALAKQTADQAALIARTSGLGLPGTVEMLTEQQKSRTAEQDVLRGEIGVLQKQGQSAKNTTIAPLQLLNELDLLVKNGQGNSQRAKDVRGLIEKEKHIAETEAYTPEGLNLAAELVRNGVVPPRGGKGAINAAAAAGVTAKDYVSGKANIAGLTQVTKTESQTGAFENTFVKNAEATLQMGRRIGKSGVPIIDEYLANPAARASGKNPELAAYDVFIKGTLNEYAKIVSGSLGNTAVAQAEIKKMEKLLNSAQTTEQLENAVNAMITETRNRRWGFKAQKAEILGQPAPAAPVNKFNLETKEVMVNGKKIKAVKGEDGKWYPK